MPRYMTFTRDDKKHTVLKYALCHDLSGEAVGDRLLELRKTFARERDAMLQLQKQFSSNRELARFFKDESRHYMKLYRACCLLIPWVVSEYPGDCELREPWEYPEELFDSLDAVSGMATL